MLHNNGFRAVMLIWAAWALILLGFQTLVDTRVQPDRPDFVLGWTPDWTDVDSHEGNRYLTEPFMNRQVSMDSEYYLSIATAGYDDPDGRVVRTRSGRALPLNYAFFPLYPTLVGLVHTPLLALNLNPVAAATLAGVIVSLLGALGGMLALYDLTRDELTDAGGIRAAFYLAVFPTGFYLAQVYTEGLFVGLSFGCLALIRRRRFLLAGILALFATWTRAVGLALIIPLALAWGTQVFWPLMKARPAVLGLVADAPIQTPSTLPASERRRQLRAAALGLLGVLLPLVAYLLWSRFFGRQFQQVEDLWFGRSGLIDLERFSQGWQFAFDQIISGENLQARVYYLLELGAVLLSLVASLFALRRYPGPVLFGLAALSAGLFSGAPQSLVRYALVVPAIYILLSRLGARVWFDRAWTLFSVLLMALLAALFTWDMWVA